MAGEAMVKGSKSAYNGRINLNGQQVVQAPISGKKGKSVSSVNTGKDLRVGK